MAYYHGNDLWNGVSHPQYSNAVETLVRNYRNVPPRQGKLSARRALTLLHWIEKGKVTNAAFLRANEDAFRVVWNWRRGFLQSITVANAARELDSTLSVKEAKAIAKTIVNKDASVELSCKAGRAMKNLKRLGKPALARAAKKVLPAVTFFTAAFAASRGFAGEGHHGSGVTGAYLEVTRDLVLADMVEGIAFPVIESTCDTIWEYLGLRNGWKIIWRKRLNKGGLDNIDAPRE